MNLIKELKNSGACFSTLILMACGQNASVDSLPSLDSSTQIAPAPAAVSVSGPVEYTESKIIGIRPLVPVRADGANLDPALRGTLDAYGLISMGTSGVCSGTHVGNGYVLTAGHCFIDVSSAGTLRQQACPQVRIHWGYRGSLATGSPKPLVNSVSNCTRIVFAELSEDRDFALIQVDSPPKASVGIALESSRTPENAKITIFGYPMGRPLEWSQFCAARKSVAVAEKPFSAPSRMAYQCDTQPGNSGSSVIAVNSAGVPKVVAIHNAAAPDPILYNIGTYMHDIRQTLAKNGFALERALAQKAR